MKVTNKTAVEQKKNKITIPIRHITTLGINDCRVTGITKLMQGDRLHGVYSQFSRLSPLVAPTFGDFKIETHAFWVPLRTIWRHYGEYVDNSSDSSFNAIKNPINFSLSDIVNIILNSSVVGDTIVEVQGGAVDIDSDERDNCDLRIVSLPYDEAGWKLYGYNFTDFGRVFWNNLQALGYGLPTYIVDTTGASQEQIATIEELFPGANSFFTYPKYSLYPLLAFARCCYDWLFPSQYVTQQGFGFLFTDSLYSRWSSSHRDVLSYIFNLVITTYDRNFYTSLWQSPNEVAAGSKQAQFSNFVTDTMDDRSLQIWSDPSLLNNTSPVIIQQTNTQPYVLGAQSLRWLTRVSDYILRNNIGGTRVQDYFKSHFGYTPSHMLDDRSQWIRTYTDNVRVQDVTNMTAIEGSVLGEQGGKGISVGSNRIKFEASENGYLIFITQVVPSVGYYQGCKELARAITSRFDIYHDDFDGVGMVGVPRKSLFSQYRTIDDVIKVPLNSENDVLGFAPNYAEKKLGSDLLTGDFLFNSRNRNLESYHTFRDVLYGRNNLAIDRQFMTADNQYQRIFAYMGESDAGGQYAQYDKIFSFFSFDFDKFTRQKSLGDSMPFFDEDGKDVSSDYEGKQL